MDIRNLIWKIKTLRSHACQDFLSLILIDNWQEEFYNTIDDYKKTSKLYADKYNAPYTTMRTIGVSQYSTKDMDVTLINTFLIYFKKLYNPIKQETIDAFDRIKDDRNITSHLNDNEDQEDLCIQAQLFLRDLEVFVRAVDTESKIIEDAKRQKYLQTYLQEISKMKKQVENCRTEKLEIEKDIKLILKSQDKSKTFFSIFDKYLQESRVLGSDEKYMAFLTEAADANVIYAADLLAMHYYDKNDYDKAEQYLSYLYANRKSYKVNPISMMLLAEIYLNNLSSKPGDGKAMLKTLSDEGLNIIESDNGLRYTLKFKNANDFTISVNNPPKNEQAQDTIRDTNPRVSEETNYVK